MHKNIFLYYETTKIIFVNVLTTLTIFNYIFTMLQASHFLHGVFPPPALCVAGVFFINSYFLIPLSFPPETYLVSTVF